jgi:hypothetical protein
MMPKKNCIGTKKIKTCFHQFMNKNLCTRKIKFILTIVNSSLLANPTLNKFFYTYKKK